MPLLRPSASLPPAWPPPAWPPPTQPRPNSVPATAHRTQAAAKARLSRSDIVIAAILFSGLALILALAAAVMVQPSLITTFAAAWLPLVVIGFTSTVGGLWWLWRLPR